MPIILGAANRIKKKGNIPHIEVHLIVINSSKYYIYALNPFQILLPSYYLKIYI